MPASAVSVPPTSTTPEIDGGARCASVGETIAGDAAVIATVVPVPFVAVTRARSVEPTSAAAAV
jgi:hypothetical protein